MVPRRMRWQNTYLNENQSFKIPLLRRIGRINGVRGDLTRGEQCHPILDSNATFVQRVPWELRAGDWLHSDVRNRHGRNPLSRSDRRHFINPPLLRPQSLHRVHSRGPTRRHKARRRRRNPQHHRNGNDGLDIPRAYAEQQFPGDRRRCNRTHST
jgi:hypothetical protein